MDKDDDVQRVPFGTDKVTMTEKIIIAGAGGQGILLLGKCIAEAAMREGRRVSWLPAYGAEVRGGTAHCSVIISEEEIGSPFIERADSLIVMNEPSLKRFLPSLAAGGSLFCNSSFVSAPASTRIKTYSFAFSDIALKLGNARAANMVALGCFTAAKAIFSMRSVAEVVRGLSSKEEIIRVNSQALAHGAALIERKS
jgi:2-oxoglutarate ferredoxin oxidoreductase subunit gamma